MAPWLLWDRPVSQALNELTRLTATAPLIVGHEPLLSSLAARLIGDGDARVEMKKAGLAVLDILPAADGMLRGTLRWLLSPSALG